MIAPEQARLHPTIIRRDPGRFAANLRFYSIGGFLSSLPNAGRTMRKLFHTTVAKESLPLYNKANSGPRCGRWHRALWVVTFCGSTAAAKTGVPDTCR